MSVTRVTVSRVTVHLHPLPPSLSLSTAALWASGGKRLIDIDRSVSPGRQRSFDSPAAKEPLGEHQSSAGCRGYLGA